MPRGRAVVVAALAATVLSVSGTAMAAVPGPDQEAAETAEREIDNARARADGAAKAFADAQTSYDALTDEAAVLAAENARLQQTVDVLRVQVEQIAVNRFVSGGSAGIPLLTGYREPNELLQIDALIGVVTQTSADAFDAYDEARRQLEANQAELAENQAELVRQQTEFEAARQRAEEEVIHLQAVEQQRLEDERVYLAALARQAEEARRAEEQRQQEAAAAAAAQAAAQAEAQEAAAAAAAEQEQQEQQQSLPAAPEPEGSGEAEADASAEANAETSAEAEASSGDSDRDGDASSGGGESSGGGGGGSGGGGGDGGGGIICPVAGSVSYTDSWGSSRSGGRSHQGVDLLAPTGTPVVAVVSGSVSFKQNRLGGNSAWLSGSDGNSYYYAHLDSFEGSSRGVSQGEVIGYVGSTGNAPVPHLHFEVHPGGGAAVNPYPYVVNAGC